MAAVLVFCATGTFIVLNVNIVGGLIESITESQPHFRQPLFHYVISLEQQLRYLAPDTDLISSYSTPAISAWILTALLFRRLTGPRRRARQPTRR